MQTTAMRDLHDWITGLGSLQERMRAKLARPAPDFRARDARLSSAPLGWRDLGLEQHDLVPGAAMAPASAGRHLVVLSLGFVASASAVVPGFDELMHGNKVYLVVTSLIGLVAFAAVTLAALVDQLRGAPVRWRGRTIPSPRWRSSA